MIRGELRTHNILISILAIACIFTAPLYTSAAQNPVAMIFVATGKAPLSAGGPKVAERRAFENALWLAVRQAADTILASNIDVEDQVSVRRLLARPRAFVSDYTINHHGPSRGYYLTTVRVKVDMDGLLQKLQALNVPTLVVGPAVRTGGGENRSGSNARVSQEPVTSSPRPSASYQSPTSQAPGPSPTKANPVQATQVAGLPASSARNTGRVRIAILPFQLGFTNPTWAQSWDISVGITELVEEALFSNGTYRIVERRQLEQVLKEQGLGKDGTVSASTVARVGRVMGIQAFVTGTVNQFDLSGVGGIAIPQLGIGVFRAQVGITARIVDTTTGEIRSIVRGSGRSDGAIVLAQLQGVAFGGGEFKNTVLGRALDQAVQELVAKLNTGLAGK